MSCTSRPRTRPSVETWRRNERGCQEDGFNFENDVHVARGGLRINRQSVINRRHLIRREFDVNNRTDDTHNATDSALAGLDLLLVSKCSAHLILQSCCATDDFRNLGRDGALTYAVIESGQRFNHLGGVVGSRLHSRCDERPAQLLPNRSAHGRTGAQVRRHEADAERPRRVGSKSTSPGRSSSPHPIRLGKPLPSAAKREHESSSCLPAEPAAR